MNNLIYRITSVVSAKYSVNASDLHEDLTKILS